MSVWGGQKHFGVHCQETRIIMNIYRTIWGNVQFWLYWECCHFSFKILLLSSLKEADKPFCERLHRVRDLMDRSKVSVEEVISELGQYQFIFDFILTCHSGFDEAASIHPFLSLHWLVLTPMFLCAFCFYCYCLRPKAILSLSSLPCIFSFNYHLVYIISENNEKCPSQSPKAQGDLFSLLVLSTHHSKTPKYSVYYH